MNLTELIGALVNLKKTTVNSKTNISYCNKNGLRRCAVKK